MDKSSIEQPGWLYLLGTVMQLLFCVSDAVVGQSDRQTGRCRSFLLESKKRGGFRVTPRYRKGKVAWKSDLMCTSVGLELVQKPEAGDMCLLLCMFSISYNTVGFSIGQRKRKP